MPTPRLTLLLLPLLSACAPSPEPTSAWNDSELRVLRSLSLASLGDPPSSVSNRVADDARAIELGQTLFFDPRLSGNGQLSCASCHQPERYFTDGLEHGVGVGPTARNTPTINGGAWQSWFYWDGRRDSLWSQALVPIEAADEMGGSRLAAVRLVRTDPDYRSRYEALFGRFPGDLLAQDDPRHAGPFGAADVRNAWFRLPQVRQTSLNKVYANIGKAIAAFERTLVPQTTPFDRYVADLLANDEESARQHLDDDAIAGARLFIDPARTQCMQCHNGPMLTNGGFHNIGSGIFSGERPDYGRMFGVQAAMLDEFNCLGPFSDAVAEECLALRFLSRDTHNPLAGAFKTPTLRNVAATGPYWHDGRFTDLMQVIRHYNSPPPKGSAEEHELRALDLSETEMRQLVAFLQALREPPPRAEATATTGVEWSASEMGLLRTFSLRQLAEPGPDPGNRWYADPTAAKLGASLFADTGLSRDGGFACSSCHDPQRDLSDGRATALGRAPLRRNAIGLLGVAHNKWLYRDGRKDSLWSQALEPIEAVDEMAGDRVSAARRVLTSATLAPLYSSVFGQPPRIDWSALPARASPLGSKAQQAAWSLMADRDQHAINRVFTNLGKSIAAFERGFTLPETRFDVWLAALLDDDTNTADAAMSATEIAGLKLFMSGSTMCVTCHNGPRFTNGQFHNIGTGDPGTVHEDNGRQSGREKLTADEFNCESEFSDDFPDAQCAHLEDMLRVEIAALIPGAFRTPSLRNLVRTAPYMHDGRFASLEDVLHHYTQPPKPRLVRHELSQFVELDDDQIDQLAAFLRTLSTSHNVN